jgi:ribosome-associated protein
MDTSLILRTVCQSALDLKALNLIKINLEGKSSISDFLVICHGTSSTHVKGITNNISLTMKKSDILPLGVEGYDAGEWILMDYDSVIVHIFREDIRERYRLENLYQYHHTQKADEKNPNTLCRQTQG